MHPPPVHEPRILARTIGHVRLDQPASESSGQ